MGAPLAVPRAQIGELPARWTIAEIVDDVRHLDGLPVRRAGIAATRAEGPQATGSAAALHGSPLVRAYAELVERTCLLEHVLAPRTTYRCFDAAGHTVGSVDAERVFPSSHQPSTWQYSRSNGVALGRDWSDACTRAARELIERDRLLRSWCGEAPPRRIPIDGPAIAGLRWEAYRLPAAHGSRPVPEVVIVLGFPRRSGRCLARGSAAGDTVGDARARALAEAIQSAAFLWDEAVPVDPPAPSPTPMFHLDYYAWPGSHDRLGRWLTGEHTAFAGREHPPALDPRDLTFVDLTPAACSVRFRVVRALSARAMPLAFGAGPPTWQDRLPADARIHPIA